MSDPSPPPLQMLLEAAPCARAPRRAACPSPPVALAVVGEKHDLVLAAGEDGIVRAFDGHIK